MSIRLLLLFFVVALAGACSRVEEHMVSALFQSYVSAQTALANDDYKAAQMALGALADEPDETIKSLVKEVVDCEDIDTARKKFQKLSDLVKELPLPEGHVVAFCPMADEGKGAYWVQQDGEIQNPYFGAKMLNCGEVTKKN